MFNVCKTDMTMQVADARKLLCAIRTVRNFGHRTIVDDDGLYVLYTQGHRREDTHAPNDPCVHYRIGSHLPVDNSNARGTLHTEIRGSDETIGQWRSSRSRDMPEESDQSRRKNFNTWDSLVFVCRRDCVVTISKSEATQRSDTSGVNGLILDVTTLEKSASRWHGTLSWGRSQMGWMFLIGPISFVSHICFTRLDPPHDASHSHQLAEVNPWRWRGAQKLFVQLICVHFVGSYLNGRKELEHLHVAEC